MTSGWHCGRQEIIDYCTRRFGVTTWQTIRAWRIKKKFPIRIMHNGRPMLIESEVEMYVLKHGGIPEDK